MSNNPYSSSSTSSPGSHNEKDLLASLKAPAICLIIVTILGFINLIAGAVMNAIKLNGAPIQDGPENISLIVGMIVGVLAGISFHSCILYGSMCMLNGENHGWAKAACIMACIPFCSPCLLLGIPFGIWGLVALSQTGVAQAMR